MGRITSVAISYGANDRTHMVRIPEPGRFELRLMDGAANPYLLQAGILAGGLDGIARRLDPGRRLDINMYEPGAAPAGIPRPPLNLLDALRVVETSTVLREALGSGFIDAYVKIADGALDRLYAPFDRVGARAHTRRVTCTMTSGDLR